MHPRPLSIRQVGGFIFVSLVVFIIIILISYESAEYFKCPPCSTLNISSTPKTFYKILNHREDEQTSLDKNSIWCLDMAHRLDSEQYLPQSPILQAPSLNSSRLNRLPYRYSQWKSSSDLARRLSPCEHTLAMRLLMIIERICRKHKIIYMLSEGTLLGSLRHHDIIPWDDDIDIMIPTEEQTRLVDIIKKMNRTLLQYAFVSHRQRDYHKIFFKNTPLAGKKPWNFPFLDIFLYIQNQTHLWEMGQRDTAVKLKYVFPLVMRPLGELWLPTPRKPRKFFQFDPFDDCKGHDWDHKKETSQEEITLKCDELKHIYPFVQQTNQSTSTEILRVNNTIIHTIIYN